MKSQIVGISTPRVEGELKVTGKAVYTVDRVLPDMLWGKVLRSPIPYGCIKRIDVSRARNLPGVKAIVTAEDAPGRKIGRRIYDMPILAENVVRFIGEKVAAVAAETEDIAEQAVDLIEIEYEEMDPVLDSIQAMDPSTPLIHPDVLNYKGRPGKLDAPSNAFIQLSWGKGSIEEGFQQADIIVENSFTTPMVHHAYIEPHSCLVKTNTAGGAEIWACCKAPYGLRDQMANAFDIPTEKFVLNPSYIGGDFGGKGDFMDVPVCYLLSKKAGQPVKMVMDYEEELTAGNPRHASIIKVKTGVKQDGQIVAHYMEFIFNSGAYGAFKPVGFLGGPQESAGPYMIPHVLIEEKMVYTNQVPCGHMRSPGDPQDFFANESQMDLIAKKLVLDPIAFRKKNLMHDGDLSPTGKVVPFIKAEATLDKALEASGYYKTKPKNVGRGLALTQWMTNGGKGTVALDIDQEGMVTLSSALVDQGGGTFTVLCEVVGEVLGIPVEQIRVQSLDTGRGIEDTGIGGSRGTRVFGNAAYTAVAKAEEELKNTAASLMGLSPVDLLLAKGAVQHAKGKRRMTYSEIVKAKGAPISVVGSYDDTAKVPDASMCVQVAEVEVDQETGEIKLRRFTSAHNTGTILNPLMHQGQIEGGIVMGLGYSLMEHLRVEDGKVATTHFGDYKIPTIRDVPNLKTAILEVHRGSGPYNSMSIGETSNIPVAAAVANAVNDAVGVRVKSLPIGPEEVLAAMKRF